jgi:hypothetical protein
VYGCMWMYVHTTWERAGTFTGNNPERHNYLHFKLCEQSLGLTRQPAQWTLLKKQFKYFSLIHSSVIPPNS